MSIFFLLRVAKSEHILSFKSSSEATYFFSLRVIKGSIFFILRLAKREHIHSFKSSPEGAYSFL